MTTNEAAAYALGLTSTKSCPTSYVGSLCRSFRMGKNEARAKAGTLTADCAAWLELDRAYFA